MKLTDMYPSALLKAQDVTDAGGEMPLTIAKIEIAEFDSDGGGKESKPIVHFTNEKKMVLNKTNGSALGELYGGETDDWIGKEVTLIVKDVEFSGKTVPAIRIKNLNSKDMLVQEFWTKTREMNLTRDEGLAHLKEFKGEFKEALAALVF